MKTSKIISCCLGIVTCFVIGSVGWAVSLDEVKSGLKIFQDKDHDNLVLRTTIRSQVYATYRVDALVGNNFFAFDPDLDGIISTTGVQAVSDDADKQINYYSSVTYDSICNIGGGVPGGPKPEVNLPTQCKTQEAFDAFIKTLKNNLTYRKNAAKNIINLLIKNKITEIGYMHPLFYPQTICLNSSGADESTNVPLGEWKPTKEDAIKLDTPFNSGNGNGLPDEIMYFLFKSDVKFDCCEECSAG